MSSIGWVDFSSTDREKVSQVLAMLREPGTLDELGIGQIRDAFADLLFPGFSTIQTRAKYFITIPRIIRDYLELDPRAQRKTSLRDYLESRENDLARLLVDRDGPVEGGIIGSEMVKNENGVARKPSSVYWNGLRQLGIVNTEKSLSEFSREVSGTAHSSRSSTTDEDDADAIGPRSAVQLDEFKPDWMTDVSIRLAESEARFLTDKLTHTPAIHDSVLSQLLVHGLADQSPTGNVNELTFSELGDWMCGRSEVSRTCQQNLRAAQAFSNAIRGAHIRFNILIAMKSNNTELVDKREEMFSEWLTSAREHDLFSVHSVDEWLQTAVSRGARINKNAREFLHQWHRAIRQRESVNSLNRLIERRAWANKGRRTILARNLHDSPEWQGMESLSYRWPTARTILNDIIQVSNA